MAGSELRQRLSELAQEFVDGVLAAIQTASLSDVASEVVHTGRRRLRGRSGMGAPGEHEASRAAPSPGPRRLKRRAGNEIEQVRDGILRVLASAGGPVGASDIAKQLGERTEALAFPMAQLRKAGRVHKEGERTQATYALVRGTPPSKGSKKRKG